MQFVIGSPEVIQIKPARVERQLMAFTRQLFGFLATQHKIGCVSAATLAAVSGPNSYLPTVPSQMSISLRAWKEGWR